MGAAIAAVLSTLSIHPVVCQPSIGAYNRAIGHPPETRWFAGVGGYYRWANGEIGLTPQTCVDLLSVGEGYTWQRGYAVFTLAHELGHASGVVDELAADCYGAKHASQIAYLFGLRDRAGFLRLRADGLRIWGYEPIPERCFAGGGP